MRNDALVRVLREIDYLRGGRRTLSEISREFGVTTRTIRRDLEVLSLAGVHVRNRLNTGEGFASYWWVVGE